MVWMMGYYQDCNSGPPCLVVDDYKKKHNFRPLAVSRQVIFKKMVYSSKLVSGFYPTLERAWSSALLANTEHYHFGSTMVPP